MTARDESAMQALSDAGAQCGDCGDQPGDRTCPDCERCYRDYVKALRAAGWAPRAEVLREAADKLNQSADEAEAAVMAHYGHGIGRGSADMLRLAAKDVRAMADTPEASTPPSEAPYTEARAAFMQIGTTPQGLRAELHIEGQPPLVGRYCGAGMRRDGGDGLLLIEPLLTFEYVEASADTTGAAS